MCLTITTSGLFGTKVGVNILQSMPDSITPIISLICFITILSLVTILLPSLSKLILDTDMRGILKPGHKGKTEESDRSSDLVFKYIGNNRAFIFDQKNSEGLIPIGMSSQAPTIETHLIGGTVYTGVISTGVSANDVNIPRRVSFTFTVLTTVQHRITTRGEDLRIEGSYFARINRL